MSHKLGDLFHHHNHKENRMSGKPSIVFCHGIWADGSCFSKLVPPLRAEGYEVICAQYNLDSGHGVVYCVSQRRISPASGAPLGVRFLPRGGLASHDRLATFRTSGPG
jgi:hypothetical protein